MAATLAEALLELQAKPPVLTKNKTGHQSKYADLVQVNEQVLSRLNELGVIWSCLPTLTDDGKFVLDYELEHVASGTKKSGRWPLKLSDNPQQMGSATTYGRRYALLAATGIAAEDEDDDGQAATGRRTVQRATQASREPAAERPTAQRARPASNAPLPGEAERITQPQMAKMQALFGEQGFTTSDDKRAFIVGVIDRELASARDLTKSEAKAVIDRLTSREEPEVTQ